MLPINYVLDTINILSYRNINIVKQDPIHQNKLEETEHGNMVGKVITKIHKECSGNRVGDDIHWSTRQRAT